MDQRKRIQSNGKTHKHTGINYWKYATLLLIGICIGSSLYLFSLAKQTREHTVEPSISQVDTLNESFPFMTLNTTKKKTNQMIAYYLNHYLSDQKIKYQFYLEKRALLKGTFKVLGYPLHFYLYFEPYVMENGNIQLKATSMSVGALGIPIKEVMRYAQKNFDFPKWVSVHPNQERIILHLNKLSLQSLFKIKADKINLVDDKITFSLYLEKEENQKGGK